MMVDHHRKHGNGCQKTRSDLTSDVSYDILKEIFLRLPLGRDLIRCSAVCKRWFSLISDSDRQFIHTFTQYHLKHSSSDHSILFRYSPESSQPFHQLRFANKSSPIKPSRDDHLEFLPKWPDVAIRASCLDLLLVSSTSDAIGEEEFYICNPLTRQWLSLPKAIQLGRNTLTSYGLVREAGSDHTMSRFKVVLISCPLCFQSYYLLYSSVFCSETGLWTQRIVSLPNALPRRVISLCAEDIVTDVVVREGVMYWLEGEESEFKALASVQFTFRSGYIPAAILLPVRGRLIGLPVGFSRGVRRPHCKDRVCLGLVRGQVQLAQLVGVNQACLVLKVWELADSDNWLLVHNKTLLKRESRVLSLLAFHPNDRNAIFVLRDREICEFKIEEGGYEKIGPLPGDDSVEEIKKRFSQHLKVFTIGHPLWPTVIPQFPSLQY